MTYDIQDFRKNPDATPIKDIDTLDPMKYKPNGRSYDQGTLKLRIMIRWARETWLNLLVRWLIRV